MTVPDHRDPRLTEQRNPRTERIDVASTLEIVGLLNAEDATVAGAVRAVRAELARAIDLVVDALGGGGRLIYVGAGTSGRLGVLDASECPPTFGTPPEMVVGVIAGGYPALVKSSEGAEDDVNAGMAAMDQARVTPADFVRGGARCDRSGRRECEAGDRDGASRGAEGGGGAPPGGGRRVRAQGGGRPAAGLAVVTTALAVGLMSGTSLDGVSTALVRLKDDPLDAQLVAFRQDPYTTPERGQIIDAIARGGSKDLALLHVALGERFAGAVLQVLAQAKVAPRDLSFIASHGQTIWHEPGRATLQLGDPAVIAERVGVRVVSDFRSRDVAAGGQGAPLVPLADVVLFGHPECGRLLLNIGGIANVTFVPRRGVTGGAIAFDTGPGVGVVDAVTRRIDPAARFDAGGERARRGKPSRKVLDALLADPYFAAPPPKSTGRERFSPDYAARLIDDVKQCGASDNAAVATATALTVETIARGIERWTPARPSDELVISGGGGRNPRLVELLTTRVAPRPVVPFDRLFFDGEAKEALVFAFLGFLTLLGAPGNLPAATGARGPRVLGHITPA